MSELPWAKLRMTAPYQTSSPRPPGPGPRASSRTLFQRLHLATWRGRFAWLGGSLVLLILIIWILARMTPSWYRPLDPSDQGVIDAAGRAQTRLYFDLHNAAQRTPLGDQPWSISQDDLNAFLAINFAGPATSMGTTTDLAPSASRPISGPCITFSRGRVAISARAWGIPGAGKSGIVGTLVFSLDTTTGPDGRTMGRVGLESAWIGCLPVPRSLVATRIRALMPAVITAIQSAVQVQVGARDISEIERALQSAGAGEPFPLQYRVDRRDIVIRDLRVDEGAFSFVLAPARPLTVQGIDPRSASPVR